MVLLFTVISYAQIPHKTRDSLQIDKIRVDTEASKILNYADNKIVGFVSFDDFVVQLVADGRLAGGGGGTDILPLTNVFTGASNTFNNGIYVGTSLSPLITKGNADYSLNIGSNLFGGGGSGSYKQVTIGQYNNLPIQTTDSWVSTDYLFVAGNGTGSGGLASNAFWLKKNGDGYFAGTVQGDDPISDNHFVTKAFGDTYYLGGTASGLQAIDEGNGTGWRLIGRDAANYGNIGLNSVDFGFNGSPSSTKGATGSNSFNIGNGTVSGDYSLQSGINTIAGNYNMASGGNNVLNGDYNFSSGLANTFNSNYGSSSGNNNTLNNLNGDADGAYNVINGQIGSVKGRNNTSHSFVEMVIGSYSTDYTPDNANAFDVDDRVFTIGIGASSGARADAFRVWKNGTIDLPSYGSGTITGTPTYNLVVDANGNILEDAIGAGGGGDVLIANNLSEFTPTASTARTNLGLGNVDDTADADKPISTAAQTELDLKETIAMRNLITASPYTTVLADDGKEIELNAGASGVTLDDTGLTVKFRQSYFNDTGGNVTITIGGGDTSKQSGPFVIPDRQYAYAELMEANVWSVIIPTVLDLIPTDASTVGVESNGVFDALALKADKNQLDTDFYLKGSADATKRIRWEIDTNVPTATDIVMTAPSTNWNFDTYATLIGTNASNIGTAQSDITELQPTSLTSTATITLDNVGGERYVTTENTATDYTVTIPSVLPGAWAKVLINASSEPTVNTVSTGKEAGATFLTSTQMYMVIYTDNGVDIKYYFLQKAP